MASQLPREAGDERSDRELVNAARAGDTAAFDALFYRHRDGIYRAALAVTRDGGAAEEILVDTFARAHRAIARLDPRDSLRPWLYRVALNLALNRRPRPRSFALAPLEDAVDSVAAGEETSPESAAERSELQHIILAAIDGLSPKHRAVVVLHYLHDLDLAEIAEIVGCPVGTVKSRLHYALRRLRTHLLTESRVAIELPRRVAAKEVRE